MTGHLPIGLAPGGQQMFVPAERVPGHLIPVDPGVRELSRISSEHAEAYVRGTLDPMVDDLRRHARAQTLQNERLFVEARDDIERLRGLVRGLPGTVAEQVVESDRRGKDDVEVADDPTLHRAINNLQAKYSWMAPQLVRLRHAVSRQAIEQHVINPIRDQMGD